MKDDSPFSHMLAGREPTLASGLRFFTITQELELSYFNDVQGSTDLQWNKQLSTCSIENMAGLSESNLSLHELNLSPLNLYILTT